MEKAMHVNELAITFGISYQQVIRLCKTVGSPAFKSGQGKTASWLCMPSKFEIFMQEMASKWKG